MANDITITSVETVNGSNQIVSSFFTFTDELVLRVMNPRLKGGGLQHFEEG